MVRECTRDGKPFGVVPGGAAGFAEDGAGQPRPGRAPTRTSVISTPWKTACSASSPRAAVAIRMSRPPGPGTTACWSVTVRYFEPEPRPNRVTGRSSVLLADIVRRFHGQGGRRLPRLREPAQLDDAAWIGYRLTELVCRSTSWRSRPLLEIDGSGGAAASADRDPSPPSRWTKRTNEQQVRCRRASLLPRRYQALKPFPASRASSDRGILGPPEAEQPQTLLQALLRELAQVERLNPQASNPPPGIPQACSDPLLAIGIVRGITLEHQHARSGRGNSCPNSGSVRDRPHPD